jgi:thioredoxin 1
MALEVTDSNFDELLKDPRPLIFDFWAEWCGPCRMIAPIIEELAETYKGKVNIGKLDVDENNEISTRFGIRNIPTILFFKQGQLVDTQVGATQKSVLVQKVESLLAN